MLSSSYANWYFGPVHTIFPGCATPALQSWIAEPLGVPTDALCCEAKIGTSPGWPVIAFKSVV